MKYCIDHRFATSVERTTRVLEIAESFGLGLSDKIFVIYDKLELEVEQGDVVSVAQRLLAAPGRLRGAPGRVGLGRLLAQLSSLSPVGSPLGLDGRDGPSPARECSVARTWCRAVV